MKTILVVLLALVVWAPTFTMAAPNDEDHPSGDELSRNAIPSTAPATPAANARQCPRLFGLLPRQFGLKTIFVVTALAGVASLGVREYRADVVKKATEAMPAALGRNDAQNVLLLINQGANLRKVGGLTLSWAAGHGQLEIVDRLLAKGVMDLEGDVLNAGLAEAAMNGHVDIVKVLLEHGAKADAYDSGVLGPAAWYGHVGIVKVLLEHGAKADGQNRLALFNAVGRGHLEIVKLLIEHDSLGSTTLNRALAAAVANDQDAVTKLLLEKGADPTKSTTNGSN